MDSDIIANELLSKVFYSDIQTSSISYIIKNTKEIPPLLEYLLNSTTPLESKKEIINHLSKSFEDIIFNAAVFQEIELKNKMTLLKILIYLFLYEESLQEISKDLISLIISHVTCDINNFRYAHDFIKQYMKYENDTYDIFESPSEPKDKLTQKQFLSYLKLLQLLLCQYKYSPKKPNDYLYCSGNAKLLIHDNQTQGNQIFEISNKNCLNIVLWMRLELSPEERAKYFNGIDFNICTMDIEGTSFS